MNLPLVHHSKIKKNLPRKQGKLITVLDKSMYVVALLPPIMTIPQIVTIWVDGQRAGVSPVTWMTYFLVSIFWTMYGIVHKEKLITVTNTLWLIVNLLVIIGITK